VLRASRWLGSQALLDPCSEIELHAEVAAVERWSWPATAGVVD